MKKLYFFLLAMVSCVIANAWTVNFTNPKNWEQVACYVYNGAGDVLGAWPGTLMEKVGDQWTISCEKGEPEKIIFNNNNNKEQTPNLDFVAGATYDYYGVVGAQMFDYSVTFKNDANWEAVYVYCWQPEMFGGYPGKQLTANADGSYTATIQAASTPSIGGFQFNNGKGGADEKKTGDLTWETGATYNSTGKVTGGGDDPNPPTPPVEDGFTYALHGQITGNTSWSSTDLKNENGIWSWTGSVVAGEFGIKKMLGTDQKGWISADGDVNITEAGTYQGSASGKNWKSTLEGNYTFAFDPATLKLTITAFGGVVDQTVTYAVHGQVNTSDDQWATVNMTENNGKWTLTADFEQGLFGIQVLTNGAQTGWLNSENATATGVEAGANGNWLLENAGNYTMTLDPEAKTLAVVKNGGDDPTPPTPPNPGKYTYAMHGQISGNSGWESLDLTLENGVWSWTGAVVAGEFGIKQMEGTEQVAWISGVAGSNKIDAEGTYNAMVNGKNFVSTLEGNYTLTFDPEAMTVTFTKFGGEIEHVITYGIHGQITGNTSWESSDLINVNGKWELEGDFVKGLFGVKKMDNGAQTDWYNSNSATATGVNIVAGENGNWELTEDGHYLISWDPEALTLTVTSNTLAAGIEIEEGEAVYFNLQGARVANPAAGIYVKVLNGKATKVIVK